MIECKESPTKKHLFMEHKTGAIYCVSCGRFYKEIQSQGIDEHA